MRLITHPHTSHNQSNWGITSTYKEESIPSKVTRNDICESCGGEVEDTIHALWECQAHNEI